MSVMPANHKFQIFDFRFSMNPNSSTEPIEAPMPLQPIQGAVQITGGQVVPNVPSGAPRTPEPCTVVIFGAAGDLVMRKLMPSLFHLARGNHLPDTMTIVGVDRVDLNNDTYRAQVAK